MSDSRSATSKRVGVGISNNGVENRLDVLSITLSLMDSPRFRGMVFCLDLVFVATGNTKLVSMALAIVLPCGASE